MHERLELTSQDASLLAAAGLLVAVAGLVVGVACLAGWRKFRRRPPGPPAASRLTSDVPPPGAVVAGGLLANRSQFGRYRIERSLGRGSMGTVYLAHDQQERAVAIKTMALGREFDPADLADARERLFREADTAARLRHPDIVAVLEAGEEQGLAFIAMEYVQGHDLLRHTLPGRLLPVPVVLRTLARVALALAYAHTQGVVHRDVKPANVMIDPDAGTVKVADFGIARIADARHTRTGMVLGTPSFMSPEQLAGRRVDGRSDLYSLGVMLFQLLTGALPHRGESMAELLNQIANETAPDVRTLRPELPEALAHVLTLALDKRPELRYGDGGQMALDLAAIADRLDPQPGMEFSRLDPRHNADH